MTIKTLVQYMHPKQELIIWSDVFVETMFTGTVEELSENTKKYQIKEITGSYIPNTIKIIIN